MWKAGSCRELMNHDRLGSFPRLRKVLLNLDALPRPSSEDPRHELSGGLSGGVDPVVVVICDPVSIAATKEGERVTAHRRREGC